MPDRPLEDVAELLRRFGDARTVLVASQAMRNEALLGPNMDPMLCEMLREVIRQDMGYVPEFVPQL